MNLHPCFKLDTKVNLKQIKMKTIRLLEVIGKLYNLGVGRDYQDTKHLKHNRKKINTLGLIRNTMKKNTIKKMKFLATDQDKMADKRFEFRINKGLIQLSNKESIHFFQQAKYLVRHFTKEVYNGKKAHEKMLNLISYQENAISNHNEILTKDG